jgi:hypothetical protein
MVKVWNKNNGNTLQIVYENSDFEPTYTCYETLVSFDCQNKNMCETKNDCMKKEPTNKKMNFITNEKKLHGFFSWIIICWKFKNDIMNGCHKK